MEQIFRLIVKKKCGYFDELQFKYHDPPPPLCARRRQFRFSEVELSAFCMPNTSYTDSVAEKSITLNCATLQVDFVCVDFFSNGGNFCNWWLYIHHVKSKVVRACRISQWQEILRQVQAKLVRVERRRGNFD